MSFLTLHTLTFSPLAEQDFPRLLNWLKMPHMKDKWDGVKHLSDIRSQFAHKIGSDWQEAFIVSLQGNSFAYIQSYRAARAGDGWWPNEGAATVGIDQFIGDAEFLNRGLGTLMVREFSDWLLSRSDVNKVITDPTPGNAQAIRCYRKAGFRDFGLVDTPGGKALLMEKLRNTRE